RRRRRMDVESLTYGSTNGSEREVFLTAALCNDEVGYQQYAEGAGCFAPESGWPRYKFARSREALFIATFIKTKAPGTERRIFSKFCAGRISRGGRRGRVPYGRGMERALSFFWRVS